MIQSVSIRDYQCFRSLEVELRPLTVAIGQNNTGKTTFLGAVQAAAESNGSWRNAHATKTFQRLGGESVVICVPHGPRRAWMVNLSSGGPPMSTVGVGSASDAPPMEAGVATVVDWMLRRDRKRFDAYVAAVRERVPGVRDVHIATPNPNTRQLDLQVEGGWVVSGDTTSAGVRLLLYFLALAWHPHPPDLVLLEEPETGLHPRRLREVMMLIRGLTEGQNAPNKVQVVLTTHSPYLLDSVDPKTDQVLVFERNEDGSCVASPLAVDRISPFLRDFGLGEIWSNEGESGLVGRS